jgi:hypothetical protein
VIILVRIILFLIVFHIVMDFLFWGGVYWWGWHPF